MAQHDVTVVGAGPVGVITALGLARAGVGVTLIERERAIIESPRAMTYLWFVLDGLERLGILQDAERDGLIAPEGLNLRIFKTGEQINLNNDVLRSVTPRPYNVLLGQDKLAAIALRHLQGHQNASVLWNTRVDGLTQDGDGVMLELDAPDGPRTLRTGWVVGADGASSTVRRAIHGETFDGITWPERFVATNVRYPFHEYAYKRANMVIDPAHGAIVALIDGRGLWRVTYCEDGNLPEETIPERMPAFFDVLLPGPKEFELAAFSPYRMHQRAAPSLREGRVVLAGDAGHITNPTGGLGLTCGLLDAYVLHEALTAVVRGEAGDEILDHYSRQRLRVFNEQASPAASHFKQLVYHTADPEALEAELEPMRAAAANPELRLQSMIELAKLRTPSLVTGVAGGRPEST